MKYRNKGIFAAIFLIAIITGNVYAQNQDEKTTRRMGLFIGSNNGGRGRVMLRYAISDARSVSRVFSDMGGISQGDNFLLIEPTISEINRQLDTLGREFASTRKNLRRTELVFYYSGHSDEEGLLLNRERYNYRDLRERINRIDTDMRIVILDSCSSGAITRAKGGAKTRPFLFDSSVSTEGYAFLTSSSATEASQESDLIESSYFTHSLVAGLRGAADTVGDGRVTLNEIYRFAYTETLAKTETSIYGAQHPAYDMQLSGSGDLVLTDIKETSASLVIDAELTGRITIRDESDFLVAELTKASQKPMELGLGQGLYRVTIQRGDDFYRAEVTLLENTRTSLAMGSFSQIASVSGERNRGAGEQVPSQTGVYTFFVNVVSDDFRFPLFGFVNIAQGNQNNVQFGFLNSNTGNFSGMQASFVNTVGGNLNGLQVGFVNTSAGDTKGMQIGQLNISRMMQGPQIGLLNITEQMDGLQLSLANISTKEIRGTQIGLFNYADSIEDGVPIGLLSIVRKGGYHAIEYSFSEFFPVTAGLKIGVEQFYSTILVAYNPAQSSVQQQFAAGIGFGSIIPISKSFFFNMELNQLSQIIITDESEVVYNADGDYGTLVNNINTMSLVPSLGFKLGKHLSIVAGPSVTWVNISGSEIWGTPIGTDGNDSSRRIDFVPMPKPLFEMYGHDIDESNRIVIGARAALRLHF